MNLYVTTKELKDFMGISGTSQDGKLFLFNKIATEAINGILGTNDCALHKVTDEPKRHATNLELNDVRVLAIDKIMDNDWEYTQDEPYDILSNRVRLYMPTFRGPHPLKISYLAGWNASGYSQVVISDIAGLAAAATVTIGAVTGSAGGTLTRGTSWTAGADEKTEAINLAATVDAMAGLRSFAIGETVYVIEDINPQASGRTIAVSDDVRLKLSSATLTGINFPEGIRGAVMYYVSNMMQNAKNPKVKAYSIGSKKVEFGSEADFQQFNNLLRPFMRARIFAI